VNERTIAVPGQPTQGDDVFVFPASFAQQRLWFLDKLEPGQGYIVPVAMRLTGNLRADVLESAIRELISRHEVLRTTFSEDDSGKPIQLVSASYSFSLPLTDLQTAPADSREDETRRLVIEQARQPFDLKKGPLFRAALFRLTDRDHVLSLAFHHTIVDGGSTGILLRELSAIYDALEDGRPSPLAAPPIQYGDYATWQQESLRGEYLEKLLAYWRNNLEGAPPVLDLPTDFVRPPQQTFSGAHESMAVPRSVEQALLELGKKEGATLFMTLLASFSLLLSRYSGQEDIVVGSPISGRTRSELEGLIGFFVNTLPLRADLSGNPTFRTLLGRVRETALQGYTHQDLPFEKLVEELNPERNLSYNPIMQVMFTFDSAAPQPKAQMSNVAIAPFRGAEGMSTKFDLSLNAQQSKEGLKVGITYNVDLFAPATIARMLEHFRVLLSAIAENPDLPIGDLRLLTDEERTKVLIHFNRLAEDEPLYAATVTNCLDRAALQELNLLPLLPKAGAGREEPVDWNAAQTLTPSILLHEFVQKQAWRTPNAVALIDGTARVSYCELNSRANQLAHRLQKLGVGPEVLVAVCTERCADMIVALLAVLKAGGAYVPLDPMYPKGRVAKILEDSHAKVMVTQEPLASTLPPNCAEVLCIDRDWSTIAAESNEDLTVPVTTQNLAYVLFTSGSTGRPKGVAIEHRSASIFVQWAQKVFTPEELSGTLFGTSICFDLSIFEMFVPLSVGGTVIIAQNALALKDLSVAKEVRLINTVPSAIAELLRMNAVPGSVLTVNLAGEALSEMLAREIYAQTSARRVYNLYGPTEDTTYSTYTLIPRNGEVTIGHPIANTQAYILDARRQPAPIGVPGELYLAGDGLARGYYGRDDLTNERFVPNLFSAEPNARMYRTGDRCRYRDDGAIEYLGRIDDQVKLRGFRIELGEIESLLVQHPALQQAVVAVREDTPGDKRLVGYVVPKSGQQISVTEIRDYLRQGLPDYMVPSALVGLAALPLTPNGKVDRKALPNPGMPEAPAGTVVAPRTVAEEKLLSIWQRALQNPTMGVTDNFFDLGGHSLMAAQLVAEMEKIFGRKIPLAALFRGATVADMARVLREGTEAVADPIVMRIQAGSSTPFFAVVAPGKGSIGYAALAQAMGSQQTFYKLQSHRAVKPDPANTLDGMSAIARDYIQAMKTVQPKGPYYLGGMCAGTHIGEQMVLQLEAAGEQVGLFAIFDTWVRQNSQVRWKWQIYYYRERVLGLLALGLKQWVATMRDIGLKKLRRMGRPLKPVETSWGKLYWPGKEFTPPLFDAPVALFKRPKQPFYYVKDEAMGWSARTLSRVEIHRIDFPHRMLREPYVRELARRLTDCLRRSEIEQIEKDDIWHPSADHNPAGINLGASHSSH
jgi:amino acid adenylation domain-containing protein